MERNPCYFSVKKFTLVDLERTTVSKTNSITGHFPTILLKFSKICLAKLVMTAPDCGYFTQILISRSKSLEDPCNES